ncbi:hypothetical protein MTBSS4_810005 [Magnetospirillum sp. SS-4]|nr:hypothetical protein MTBSS4_810005 [Magnetospirillum sp. SS-4]
MSALARGGQAEEIFKNYMNNSSGPTLLPECIKLDLTQIYHGCILEDLLKVLGIYRRHEYII